MPVCSYLVFPAEGRHEPVQQTLEAIPGCEVTPARGAEVMILVTDTEDGAAESTLRERLDAVQDIQCLVLVFGEVDADDAYARRTRRSQLPTLDPKSIQSKGMVR